jgi:hypothetical protein
MSTIFEILDFGSGRHRNLRCDLLNDDCQEPMAFKAIDVDEDDNEGARGSFEVEAAH